MSEGEQDQWTPTPPKLLEQKSDNWLLQRVKQLESGYWGLIERNRWLEERHAKLTSVDESQRQIQAEIVQAMREMLPAAKRAALRGKPALLRLIVRTLRLKF